ncbi:MAG: hypothetical protein ACI376_01115 [Candidatus Bruticola sp.]
MKRYWGWRVLFLAAAILCTAETAVSLFYDSPNQLIIKQRQLLKQYPSFLLPLLPYCGWLNRVGTIEVDEEGCRHSVTIWPDGQRASRPYKERAAHPRVLMLGCSYLYGFGLNDEQTLAWKLNQHYPQASFDNYGTVGWGTYQSLLLGEYLLRSQTYDLVLYFYIKNHCLRSEKGKYAGQFKMGEIYAAAPEVFMQEDMLCIRPSFYYNLPLKEYFALAEYSSLVYNAGRQEFYAKASRDGNYNKQMTHLIRSLCDNFSKVCADKKSQFAVVLLEDNTDYLDSWGQESNYPVLDIRFESENVKYRNGGNERFHPNEAAQDIWLAKLEEQLKKHYKIFSAAE